MSDQGERDRSERTAPGTASGEAVAATAAAQPRLRVRDISKSYEGIHALEDVSFDVLPGEIHALVGENGAGKSTLVKIVTGLVEPDGGSIELDGEAVRFATPMQARDAGVSAVYQDPKLFPHLDVAENIFMGIFPRTPGRIIDRRGMYAETERLLDELWEATGPVGRQPSGRRFESYRRSHFPLVDCPLWVTPSHSQRPRFQDP